MVILYADDDPEDHEVFAEIIQSINPAIRIIRADDGLQTMELLSNDSLPDIIFLDVNMPGLNGFQALTEIRQDERLKHLEVILYSTNTYRPAFWESDHINTKYVRKPNTIREGVETLRVIIGRQNTNLT
jgi:CheY-like chemotaxis protein